MISVQAMTDPILILRVLLLLGAANGAPILASRLLGERWNAVVAASRSHTRSAIVARSASTRGSSPPAGRRSSTPAASSIRAIRK